MSEAFNVRLRLFHGILFLKQKTVTLFFFPKTARLLTAAHYCFSRAFLFE